jgi:hypothetical protein
MKKLYFLMVAFLVTSLSFGQVINEIDPDQSGSDTAEFVEIKWTPNTALDGMVIVMYNGSDDASYAAYDLDGQTTDANGFFVLGSTNVAGYDMELPNNGLQNGADAVALFTGNDTDFPNDTAITTTNLIDVIVYGTNDGDDAGLLGGFGVTTQYNDTASESIQRQNDGSFLNAAPTPDAENSSITCDLQIGAIGSSCDAITVNVDTYTATIAFTGGGTGTYTVMASEGTVDLSAGDPSTDATGTITVNGVPEGTDVTVTIQDGGVCDFSPVVFSPDCVPGNALPLYDGFDYTVGNDLGSESLWNNFSGSGNPIDVVADNLSYTGIEASSGNAVNLIGGGEDAEITFNEVSSGEIYASFMLKVNDLSAITDLNDGGYFAIFGGFDARLWIHPDTDPVGTTFDFAYSNGSVSTFSTSNYNVGDTIFVVMSYNTDSGVLNAWINPAESDLGGSAPTATLTDTDTTPGNIGRFALRQDSTGETPGITFDELRLGTSWATVTPTTLSTNNFDTIDFGMYPNPTSTGKVTITTSNSGNVTANVYDVLGKEVINRTVENNTLDVSNLNAGLYIVKLTQNGNSVTKKLVIK